VELFKKIMLSFFIILMGLISIINIQVAESQNIAAFKSDQEQGNHQLSSLDFTLFTLPDEKDNPLASFPKQLKNITAARLPFTSTGWESLLLTKTIPEIQELPAWVTGNYKILNPPTIIFPFHYFW
jgi:hypothetical protein